MKDQALIHFPKSAFNSRTVREFLIAAALDEAELVCDYIESYGVDPDSTINGKPTALCYAAIHGNFELVRYLVKRGANLLYRDALDMTPLHYAVRGGSLHTVSFLLEKGACCNSLNRFGKTPYDLARTALNGRECMSLLRCYGHPLTTRPRLYSV